MHGIFSTGHCISPASSNPMTAKRRAERKTSNALRAWALWLHFGSTTETSHRGYTVNSIVHLLPSYELCYVIWIWVQFNYTLHVVENWGNLCARCHAGRLITFNICNGG